MHPACHHVTSVFRFPEEIDWNKTCVLKFKFNHGLCTLFLLIRPFKVYISDYLEPNNFLSFQPGCCTSAHAHIRSRGSDWTGNGHWKLSSEFARVSHCLHCFAGSRLEPNLFGKYIHGSNLTWDNELWFDNNPRFLDGCTSSEFHWYFKVNAQCIHWNTLPSLWYASQSWKYLSWI